MRKPLFAVSALAVSLGATSGGLVARAHAFASPAQPQYEGRGQYQDQGRWDEPPSEYRDAQRMGFRDGVDAAQEDFDRHSRKDADDHDRYKHPRVERELVNDYRSAFREGYGRAMRHLRDEGRRHDDDDRDRRM